MESLGTNRNYQYHGGSAWSTAGYYIDTAAVEPVFPAGTRTDDIRERPLLPPPLPWLQNWRTLIKGASSVMMPRMQKENEALEVHIKEYAVGRLGDIYRHGKYEIPTWYLERTTAAVQV